MVISTPSSPIYPRRPWEWLAWNQGDLKNTAKTSKNFWGDLYPPVRNDLCPSYSMSCCAWCFLLCKTWLYHRNDLVQRVSTSPGSFRGLESFVRLPFEISQVKLVESSPNNNLFVKSANDLYLYVFLLTIFELLGQLSMWLPAREFIRKAHFDMAYAGALKPVILLFLPQIASSMSPWIRTMLGALASTKDVGYDQTVGGG